jgi:murein L,D-transpeptidase YcbB/YkuD
VGADRLSGSRSRRPAAPIALVALWLLPACAAGAGPAIEARTTAAAPPRAAPSATRATLRFEPVWLERVYSPTRPEPVWFTPQGPRAGVEVALRELRAAGERGLSPDDYDIATLERLVAVAVQGTGGADAVTRADRALSATVLQFLSDLRLGRVPPQQVEPYYSAQARPTRFAIDLREVVAEDRLAPMIAGAEPAFAQYAQLKRLLADYRMLAARPPSSLPAPASARTKVVVGDDYVGAPELHAALVALGDLPPNSEAPFDGRYSAVLAMGVTRFQARHGLAPDGVLGKQTLAALNAPVAMRISQIALSLERLRWLPDFPPGPLIAVNIPSFQLWALADATTLQRATLTMPVVVGRAMRSETPVFIGDMRYVEFSPYWNVPSGILRDELLPRIAEDPSYLEREDMEIVTIRRHQTTFAGNDPAGIAALRSGNARLRQRPGPRNALGRVKFALPNTMDIYLHATPAQELFARTRRDFSHGCVRVSDPEALASFVLRGQPQWTPAQIEAAMTSGVNRTVALAASIPVVVFYTTALVDGEGRAIFLPDIYGHDGKLLAALRGGRGSTP